MTSVDLSLHDDSADEGQRFWTRLLEDVRQLPRTESASLTTRLPLDLGMVMQPIAPEGFQPPAGRGWPSTEAATIATDYLRTVGTPLVEGREFTDRDSASAPLVIVLLMVCGWRRGCRRGAPCGSTLPHPRCRWVSEPRGDSADSLGEFGARSVRWRGLR
jgi:hypothetical protein